MTLRASAGELECKPGAPPANGRFTSETIAPARLTRPASCFVDSGTFLHWREHERVAIVDVRRPEEFARIHAPGSLNFLPSAVRHKSYLRQRYSLLIGRAGAEAELGRLCTELREAGFQHTAVLDGGLKSWLDRVGPLEGDPAAVPALAMLSTDEAYRASLLDHWLFVNASDRSQPDLFPSGSVSSPLSQGQTRFVSRVKSAVGTWSNGSRAPFILFLDQDGTHYAEIGRAIAPLHIEHVYYAQGGIDAYAAFAGQRALLVARAAKPWDKGCKGASQ